MKKIFLIFLIIFYSCGTEYNAPYKYYNYTIINESSYLLEIIPYAPQGQQLLSQKIVIPSGSRLTKNHREGAPYGGYGFSEFINRRAIEKVEFVFSNSRKIIYERCISGLCVDGRNILDARYNSGSIGVYIITNDDYDNAIDCGGNCN